MPDWNRGQIRAELLAHGFQYLGNEAGRANGFVERAVEEIIQEHEFSFRERYVIAVPGDPITGLGKIEQVSLEDGTILEPRRLSDLREQYGRVDEEGVPRYYYSWGAETIYVYPASTENIAVHHYTISGWVDVEGSVPESAADSDEPIIPAGFRDLILLLALCYAREDVESPEAEQSRLRYEERLDDLRSTIHRQVDEPDFIKLTGEPY